MRLPSTRLVVAVLTVAGLFATTLAADAEPRPDPGTAATTPTAQSLTLATTTVAAAASRKPLRGKVIVVDPGHQLGNSTHPEQVNRMVDAGGFQKACNTTGTATNAGFPEASFTWLVARSLKRQLERQGAQVYLTRHSNSYDDWGPCIDKRGRKGNKVHADAVVSVHGDGAAPSARGFFVIMPSDRRGWTDDIFRSSHRLGVKVRSGLKAAGVRVANTYGGDGVDVRGDLGTLNWSNRPIVMIEMGNMRNRVDAQHMTTPSYRKNHYARGLALGLKRFLLKP